MDTSRRLRVLVLFGGRSAEHEISCLSARNVLDAMDPERYEVATVGITREGRWALADVPGASPGALPSLADEGVTVALVGTGKSAVLMAFPAEESPYEVCPVDVCFPVLHGPYGEDGTVQGLLATHGIPYVGADVASSALGIDKAKMKNAFTASGLPQVEHTTLSRSEWERDREGALARLERAIPYPCFTKPARQGSSIGIARCPDRSGLVGGITEALEHDRVVIVEPALSGARELECGVLGNVDIEVTPPGEVVTAHEFYDYEGKYLDEGLALNCPANVDEDVRETCVAYARAAFLALGSRGMARVDFFYLEETGEILVNEINTIPGFTAASMFPRAWEAQGLECPQLVDRLLELALSAAETDARFAP